MKAPIKFPPIRTILGQRKLIPPGKFSFRNPKLFLIASQILVIKVVKAISASNVIPRAHLPFLPLSLHPLKFGPTDRLRRGATKQE
jgi:hypothetical protein